MLPINYRLVTFQLPEGSRQRGKGLHACIMRTLQSAFNGSRGMAAFVAVVMSGDADGNEVSYFVAWHERFQNELDSFMQQLFDRAVEAAKTLHVEIKRVEHSVTPVFFRARLGARQMSRTVAMTQHWPRVSSRPAVLQRLANAHEPFATASTELLFACMQINDGEDEGKIFAISVYDAPMGADSLVEQVQKHWADQGMKPSSTRRLTLPTGGLIVFP